jgi:hypothetical protein
MTTGPAAPRSAPAGQSSRDIGFGEILGAMSVEAVPIVLPSSRRQVTVPGYARTEVHWRGELPTAFGSVPNKLAFSFDGAALYPELIVVRLLERAGWSAAWRKNWNTVAYWRDIGEPIEPSALAVSIVDQVSRQAGHVAPWDIVAWRDRELRFLVSRSGGGQRVGAYLANWLDAALRMGIPLGCFAIVEHQADRLPKRR